MLSLCGDLVNYAKVDFFVTWATKLAVFQCREDLEFISNLQGLVLRSHLCRIKFKKLRYMNIPMWYKRLGILVRFCLKSVKLHSNVQNFEFSITILGLNHLPPACFL